MAHVPFHLRVRVDVLPERHYPVYVVPPQAVDDGLDRLERSLVQNEVALQDMHYAADNTSVFTPTLTLPDLHLRRRTVFMLGFSSTACSIFKILPWYSSTTSKAWSTTVFQSRQYHNLSYTATQGLTEIQ